ncbi:MAG: hypothetical protein ABIJ57_10855 [Pseudomonadota bacterium]
MSDKIPAPEGQAGGAPPRTPFLKLDDSIFDTEEDLRKHLRDGSLRQSDYTKKTQELARQRKALEQKEVELQSTLSSYAKYKEYDDFLKTDKGKKALERIEREMNEPTQVFDQAKSYADKKAQELEAKLSEMEKWKAEQETDKARQKIFEQMKGKYKDFDDSLISKRIASLSESPEGTEMEDFVDLIYWAEKAKAGQQPRQVTMETSERPPMTSSANTGGNGGVATPSTIGEAAEAARRDLGISEGE